MSLEARQAEFDRVAAGMRLYIAAVLPNNVHARDALSHMIDQLASMIPAGGLAEEARDAARWRSVRDATGDLAASAKYAVSAATASEANRIADAIIAAGKSKEQPR